MFDSLKGKSALKLLKTAVGSISFISETICFVRQCSFTCTGFTCLFLSGITKDCPEISSRHGLWKSAKNSLDGVLP